MIKIKPIIPDSTDAEKASMINREAFPPLEYISLEELFSISEKGDGEVLGFYHEEELTGFAWTIRNARSAYIFFLAIDARYRGQGYGTQSVNALFRYYSEKQVVLDFEIPDPAAENYEQRIRRKAFYLRCGFHETGRFTMLRGERFEVVCNGGPLDTDSFSEIVKLIHERMPIFHDVLL